MANQMEQMNRLLDPNSVVREGEMGQPVNTNQQMFDPNSVVREGEMGQMLMEGKNPPDARKMLDPNSVAREGELQMITNAQMGLMEMDPEGTKDVVQGLEMTKQKVMGGEALSEGESSGIMAILQKLGGALSGLMGGGADQPMQQVMVDGNVTMLTAKEIMSAKNAGMLVQPVDEAIRDMEMQQ